MKSRFLLAKFSDCYALLNHQEIQSGKGFMADSNGIYEVPAVDGFIGFLNVVACTIKKGDLPLIDQSQILIPTSMKEDGCWVAKVELDDADLAKVRNGFINLIGIQVPNTEKIC